MYFKSKEFNRFEKEIVDKVHLIGQAYIGWKNLIENLSKEYHLKFMDFTDGQTPCFSAMVQTNALQNDTSNLECIKEIWLFQSIIGSYFSVIGSNYKNNVNSHGRKVSTQIQTCVSPNPLSSDIYNITFNRLENFHKKNNFINYKTGMMSVNEVQLPHSDQEVTTIFSALFCDFILLDTTIVGDIDYLNKQRDE